MLLTLDLKLFISLKCLFFKSPKPGASVVMALKSFTRLNFLKLRLWPIFVAKLSASCQKSLVTDNHNGLLHTRFFYTTSEIKVSK